jgi:hypothetical protein
MFTNIFLLRDIVNSLLAILSVYRDNIEMKCGVDGMVISQQLQEEPLTTYFKRYSAFFTDPGDPINTYKQTDCDKLNI